MGVSFSGRVAGVGGGGKSWGDGVGAESDPFGCPRVGRWGPQRIPMGCVWALGGC